MLWLYLVHELRKLGTALPPIKIFKEKINEKIPFSWVVAIIETNMDKVEKNKESIDALKNLFLSREAEEEQGFSILLLLVVESIIKKTPVTLILFNNGEWLALHEDKNNLTKAELERIAFETHIRVSLAKSIKKLPL